MPAHDRPPRATENAATRVGPPVWLARLVVALVVVPSTGLFALFAVAMTGWGFETDPGDQLKRDLPMLVVSGLAGAACGASLGFALTGPRRAPILALMLLGVVPAVVKGTAYLTNSY